MLVGTDGRDVICGLGGDDKILGRGGDDLLRGGGGSDVVRGGPGDDRVAGGRGDDRVFGQGGDDVVRGDSGDDEVVGGPGNDRMGGFRGADELIGTDGPSTVDTMNCGPGPDVAAADPDDVVMRNCETVTQNDPPTDITLAPSAIPENEAIGADIGDLTAADPDAGDSHTFTLVPGAGSDDNALVQIDGESLESAVSYDFETDPSLSVRLRATDAAGEFIEKALTVTVTDANDAPVAVDDDATAIEDTQLDLPVSGAGSPAANDTDQDGDALTVSAVSSPTGGTVSLSGGQVHFVPAANLCGPNAGTFVYTVSDGGSPTPGTDTGTVTVDITCVDDAPDAVDDDRTVAEDAGATPLNVLANDTDPENDGITVTGVSDPANGATSFTAADVSYTPDADYCNSPPPFDTFTYTVNGGDTATVRVTVTCVNDAPVAVDDDRTTTEDTPLQDPVTGAGSPAANDTDVDSGDTLTVTSVTNAVGGTADIASGQITFTPTANSCAPTPASYDYVVSDGNGGTDTGKVTVDVTCVNDPPVANDDSRTVAEDSGPTTFLTLRGNDTDVESDPITITAASDPANGTTSFTANDVTYTPDANYCNDPGAPADDTFTYTVNGGDTATVSVTVTCVNDAPVADDDSATVTEDAPAAAIDVLGNDDDVDGDAITITSASDPANGTVVLTGGTAGAHTGLTYEPDPDYCNAPPGTTPDTFTYTVNGGGTATVSVTVTCVDDDPTADDDTATVTLNDPATAINVLGNDDDVDGGPMAIASASDPVNGTVVLTGGTPGNHTGLTYEPDTGYCNTDPVGPADTFTYTLTPGGDSATVSVTVTCDAPPVGVDDTATVAEDSGATAVDVLGNDSDGGDGGVKAIASTTQPANGTVVLTGGTSGAHTGLTYEPDPNYCNDPVAAPDDTFTYTLTPGGDTADVAVTVTCVDDAPVANDDSRTVAEDSGPTTFNTVLDNDSDVEGDPITITGVSDPANGTTGFTAGDVTYTPDANYCNTPPPFDTFTYTVNGGDTATVSVTVTCVPDAPTLDNSAGTTTYTEDAAPVAVDGTVTITNPDGLAITAGSVTLTDELPGDVLDWTDNNPADSITEGTSTALQVNLTGTGTANEWEAALEAVTFATPSQNPSGADRTATFQVTTSAGSPSDTKLVDAANVDDPPTADDDAATVLEDAAATAVTVLANDDDVDGGPMTIASATQPDNGTVVLTGPVGASTGLTYQPNSNYCNDPPGTTPDTFTYTLDGASADPTATVSMTVTCVNDAPVAGDETFDGTKSAIGNTSLVVDDPTDAAPDPAGPQRTVTGDILANDTDIDGPGPLTITPGTFASNDGGSVTLEADGDFTYVSDPADSCDDASDFFDYTISDGNTPTAGTDVGRVTIAVTECVWYVDASAGAGNGTSAAPFNSLTSLNGAGGAGDSDGASDYLFVYGGGAFTTGLPLETGQRLFGQPHGLTVDGTALVAAGSTNPTLSAASGNALTLGTDNTVQGINLGSTTAGAASLAGTSVGTATVNTVTPGSITNATGTAVDISGGTLAMTFASVSSTGATNDGIRLDNTAGTFTATGGALQNAGGQDVDISGDNAGDSVDFTYGGTITDDVGQLVNVSGQSGGTKDFNGAITDGDNDDGGGVSLTNNSGATVRFDGGLVVATATATALNATGGGTLAVTDPAGAAANTLSSTSGIGLNVVNTAIHADDLTFQGITAGNATAAADPVSGIVLTNTTNTGGKLVVTGNGGTCSTAANCSGGAVQNTTGPGVNLTSVPGGVALTRLAVTGAGDDGIRATTVGNSAGDGLSLANSVVTGNGNAVNENGLDFDNVLGTSAISATTVTGNAEFNGRFDNDSGTGLLSVSSSTFSNNSTTVGADGLLLNTDGTATVRALVQNSTFAANRDDGFQLLANADSTVDLTFNGNTVNAAGNAGAVSAHAGVTLTSNSTTDVEIGYNGGSIVGADGSALIVNPVGTASTFDATIENLTIGTAGVPGSGSATGMGMRVIPTQNTDAEIVIRNNTIHGTSQWALFLRHNDGDGASDFTVTGNTVRTLGAGNEAIFVQSGGVSTDDADVCADIGGAGALENDFAGQASGGVDDIAFNRRTNSVGAHLRLPGFDGNAANLATYIQGRNVGSPTVGNFGQNLESGPASCQQPTAPTLP